MKLLLLALSLLALALPGTAQNLTPPSTCVPGEVLLDTGGQGQFTCDSVNHWTYVPVSTLVYTQIGVPNGVAPLDSTGKIPASSMQTIGGDIANTLTNLIGMQISGESNFNPVVKGLVSLVQVTSAPTGSCTSSQLEWVYYLGNVGSVYQCSGGVWVVASNSVLQAAGTANCTAIQNTISAAQTAGGGTVHLPAIAFLEYSPVNTSCWNISVPNISLVGDSPGGTIINYQGSGYAGQFQMNPFTIVPAGKIQDLQIYGTAAAQGAIKTGATISAVYHHIHVVGFTNGAAYEIDDDGNIGNWTERNYWYDVSESNNLYGWKLQNLNNDPNYSFGYNTFVGLLAEVYGGQTAFWQGGGTNANTILYSSEIDLTCNMSNANAPSSNAICFYTNGSSGGASATNNVFLRGEGATSGSGHLYSTYQDTLGQIVWHGSLSFGASPITQYNAASPSFIASARIAPFYSAQDTGLTSLPSGSTATATPYSISAYGGFGEMNATGIASPYAVMRGAAGNYFTVYSLTDNNPMSAAVPQMWVDSSGDLAVKGLIQGALSLTQAVHNASYTLQLTDGIVFMSGSGLTLTLPNFSPFNPGPYYIVNYGSSAITISNSVGGNAPTSLAANTSLQLASIGGGWYKLN